MAGEIQDLTSTAASHPRAPEGMAPSSVNDGMRAVEGIISRWFFDTNYSVVGTVSGTVIQLTANRVSLTLTGTTSNYMADLVMAFTMGSVNQPVPASINLNGIGPISLRDAQGTSLSSTVMLAGQRCLIVKDATNDYFRLLRPNYPTPRGTATNDSAAAGYIGEYLHNETASVSAVSLTTNTAANAVSVSLTAGDWDVEGCVYFTGNAATTLSYTTAAINTTSATLPTTSGGVTVGFTQSYNGGATVFAAADLLQATGRIRISLSVTTTVYLVAKAVFGVNSCSAYGQITARRVR